MIYRVKFFNIFAICLISFAASEMFAQAPESSGMFLHRKSVSQEDLERLIEKIEYSIEKIEEDIEDKSHRKSENNKPTKDLTNFFRRKTLRRGYRPGNTLDWFYSGDRDVSYETHDFIDATYFPRTWQSGGSFHKLSYKPAGTFSSNPNYNKPWIRPAGTSDVGKLYTYKSIALPKGKFIEYWDEYVGDLKARSGETLLYRKKVRRWRYPVGAKVTELLADGNGPYFKRVRTKVANDTWEPEQEVIGKVPQKFDDSFFDCMSCHKDAGQHVTQLSGHRTGRHWYGHLSGDDTVFISLFKETGEPRDIVHDKMRMVNGRPSSVKPLRGQLTGLRSLGIARKKEPVSSSRFSRRNFNGNCVGGS